MRRGMLMFVGLGGCGILLLALCMHVAAQYAQPETKVGACLVAGTPLEIVSLASYDGPFWEDQTDREVMDVAAILLENTGDSMVAQGTVIIDWETGRYVFEFSCLPPKSQTLVLESTAKAFQKSEAYECYGWSRQQPLPVSAATVTAGDINMTLHNPTNEVIPALTVGYKHYHAESATYIGGITYQISAEALQPGEQRILCPDHFSAQGSAILFVQP